MSDSWIPEQLQDAPFFRPSESGEQRTPEQVLSDLTNAARLQGDLSQSHLRLPGEGEQLSEEALERLAPHLPEPTPTPTPTPIEPNDGAPEEYELPDGLEETQVATLIGQAHGLGLNQSQFEQLLEQSRDQVQQHHLALKDLQQEWGYDAEVNQSKINGLLRDAPDGLQAAAQRNELDSGTLRWLLNIADAMGEEAQAPLQRDSTPTPADNRQIIATLKAKMGSMRTGSPEWERTFQQLNNTLLKVGTTR